MYIWFRCTSIRFWLKYGCTFQYWGKMLILPDVHMQMFVIHTREIVPSTHLNRKCWSLAPSTTSINIADRSYSTARLIFSIRHSLRGIAIDHYCPKQLVIWTGKVDRVYHECWFGRCEEYNALLLSVIQYQRSLIDIRMCICLRERRT